MMIRAIPYYFPNRVTQAIATLHFGSGYPATWMEPKERKAIAIIRQWKESVGGKVCHYLSGGKDSLVVGHQVRQVIPDCPMVWINQGPLAEWADCLLLLDYLKEQGWNIVEICPPRSLWHLYKDYGIPLASRMTTPLDKRINKALMYDPIAEFEAANNIQGATWGLRRESRGRMMFIQKCGTLYQRKDEHWICSPIGFWRTEEVWQYIDRHRLPYPAFYDRDRTTVRNGPPVGTTGITKGRLSLLRRYHPEIWTEFMNEFPELRNYC